MDCQRFLDAQEPVFEQVLKELRAGNKTSHWMWFIFPQLRDLGRSATARFYGLENRTDAVLYLVASGSGSTPEAVHANHGRASGASGAGHSAQS
jgi:uncharacterized protein (DUF1810 family)